MYTGYYFNGDHIYGPKDGGQFYVSGNHIYGPRNSGRYYISNGHIYGPEQSGQFYLHDGHIYGPSKELPWMSGNRVQLNFCNGQPRCFSAQRRTAVWKRRSYSILLACGAQNGVKFDWPADHTGWRLTMNTNGLGLPNAWFTVPNSAATNQIWLQLVPTQESVFFRLVFP
jgi:hypothetical protein